MGTYWCCCQSRRDRTDTGTGKSAHSSLAGLELSADPLAPSSASATQGQSGKQSRRSRTDQHARHAGDKPRNSTAPRSSIGSVAADIATKPEPSRPSVTGSGHMALQGAPVQGESATMVITDIQSSAKLTNSMPSAMMADSDRHERLLRHLMLLYNGIEVATEGDSFHVVFREASDAVRWCVAVQMELLLRNWQTSTSGKCVEDVGLVTIPEAQADCPLPLAMKGLAQKKCPKKPNSRVIFDGLRVRMGGHTDVVTHHRFDHDKNQHHYSGDLFETTRAVSESGSGGQIVFSQATIRAVQSLTHVSSSRYGDVMLMHEGRHYVTSPSPPERDLVMHFRRLAFDQVWQDESTTTFTSTHITQPHVPGAGAMNLGMSGETTSGMLSGVSAPIGAGTSVPVGEGRSESGSFSGSGVGASSSLLPSTAPTNATSISHIAMPWTASTDRSTQQVATDAARPASAPDAQALGKLMGEKMEQQVRRHERMQLSTMPATRIAVDSTPDLAAVVQARQNSEADMTESSTMTSPFPSPHTSSPSPFAFVRTDTSVSERWPGQYQMPQRRTSDPSGQSLPLTSTSKPVQMRPIVTRPNVIAVPTGSYSRPTRTTGNIMDASFADHTVQFRRNVGAASVHIGGKMMATSGSAGALYHSASGARNSTETESPDVSQAFSKTEHSFAGTGPLGAAVSASSGDVISLAAAAQRAVWEPWSKRMMGLSNIQRKRTNLELFTVMPEYLKPRHEYFPQLNTKLRITPAFADAPRDGDVTICYTFITHIKDINAWSVAGAKAVVHMACALIRDMLVQFSGYEIRENSGNFLLSFGNPEDALGFCVASQKAFMHHDWDEELLKLPFATVHKDVCEGKDLVFRGPRIHCGLSSGSFAEGFLTAIVPDARTGRAQYHGKLCNHAARVASIAHGGQTVASERTIMACDHAVLRAQGVQLKDLGLFLMKGFGGEHRIWQVEDTELARRVFPEGPPDPAGKVTPISKRPGGMLSSLRKRLRRNAAGGTVDKPGRTDLGDNTSALTSSFPRLPGEVSANSSVTTQAIKMTSQSIKSGSVDVDDVALPTGDSHIASNTRSAHAHDAAAAVGMLAGVSLFPSQRRAGLQRSGGRGRQGTSPGKWGSTGANSVSISAPCPSGPSASTDRGERVGPLGMSYDSQTMFSDETAWLSGGHNQQSSLLSDVRTAQTPLANNAAAGALGGSFSGEEAEGPRAVNVQSGAIAAAQGGYSCLADLLRQPSAASTNEGPLVFTEASAATHAATGCHGHGHDTGFGSRVDMPYDPTMHQHQARLFARTSNASVQTGTDIDLGAGGPVLDVDQTTNTDAMLAPGEVAPASEGVSDAYASAPWPTSLTAPWLAGGTSSGRAVAGGATHSAPCATGSQARTSLSERDTDSAARGSSDTHNPLSVCADPEGGVSVTLGRAVSETQTRANNTGSITCEHSVTAAPGGSIMDATRGEGDSTKSVHELDAYPSAFYAPTHMGHADADEGVTSGPVFAEQSRISMRSGHSGFSGSTAVSPMAHATQSGNMELILGDYMPSRNRRAHAQRHRHTGDSWKHADATSDEIGGVCKDPGTPAVEQGTEDEDELNFVYNFDPHVHSSFHSNSTKRDHRTESVRLSAGASDICFDSLDQETDALAAVAAAAAAQAHAAARHPLQRARPSTEPLRVRERAASSVASRPTTVPQPASAAPHLQVDLTPFLQTQNPESPRLPGTASSAYPQGVQPPRSQYPFGSALDSHRPAPPPQPVQPAVSVRPMQMAGVDAFVSGAPTLSALQLALQFCDTAMELTNVEGILLHVNPAWVNLTGYSASDVVGTRIADLIAESNGFFASTTLQNGVPAPGVVTEGVEHMQCMDGGRMWHHVCRVSIPVESSAQPSPLDIPCTLVILSRRLDMTAELAQRYTIDS